MPGAPAPGPALCPRAARPWEAQCPLGLKGGRERRYLLFSLSPSSVLRARLDRPSLLATFQGLCLLQALGGMKEGGGSTWGRDSWTGHSSAPPANRGFWSLLRESVELRVLLALLPNGHLGTPRPQREVRLESAPPCSHLRAESLLSLSLWTGLTDLCGRMGLAGSLCPHLTWTCSPLSWLSRATIIVMPRRALTVPGTPRRSRPGASSVWPLPSACCS